MNEWRDADGNSLGEWVEIDYREYLEILGSNGGYDALNVFSSLTDPNGLYGSRQIYTAWGRREDDVPLLDVRDYKGTDGRTTERQVRRKFVPATREGGGR